MCVGEKIKYNIKMHHKCKEKFKDHEIRLDTLEKNRYEDFNIEIGNIYRKLRDFKIIIDQQEQLISLLLTENEREKEEPLAERIEETNSPIQSNRHEEEIVEHRNLALEVDEVNRSEAHMEMEGENLKQNDNVEEEELESERLVEPLEEKSLINAHIDETNIHGDKGIQGYLCTVGILGDSLPVVANKSFSAATDQESKNVQNRDKNSKKQLKQPKTISCQICPRKFCNLRGYLKHLELVHRDVYYPIPFKL